MGCDFCKIQVETRMMEFFSCLYNIRNACYYDFPIILAAIALFELENISADKD
jgi:hypothetical protein